MTFWNIEQNITYLKIYDVFSKKLGNYWDQRAKRKPDQTIFVINYKT